MSALKAGIFSLLVAILTVANVSWAQDAVSVPVLDHASAIRASWTETQAAVRSAELSNEQKSGQIDRFFATVESACVQRCDLVLETLGSLNSKNTPEARKRVLSYLAQNVSPAISDSITVKAETASAMAQRLEVYLRANPKELGHRLSAALEATRALVAFQEDALFESLSSDTESAQRGREKIAKDIAFFKKQAEALWDIGQIVRKFKSTDKVEPEEMKRVVQRISDLGIFYIKLAQTLSNLTFVLPTEVAGPLRVFQDKVEPMTAPEVMRVMTRELGRPPSEIYSDFDPSRPLASGSIGVTFEAKLRKNGRTVIIKVQREGLEEQLDFNRRFNRFAMRAVSAAVSEKIAPVVDFFTDQVVGLENGFGTELDFRNEARNLNRFRRLFALTPGIDIPKVVSKYSSRFVMTMEKIEGSNLQRAILAGDRVDRTSSENQERVERMDKLGLEPAELDRRRAIESTFSSIFESSLYMVFVVGQMHADLHPGNLLAQKFDELESRTNHLGVLDFAQVVRTRGLFLQPLKAAFALVTGNAEGLARELVMIGSDPNYPMERLLPMIEAVFKENGLKRRTARDLLGKKMAHDSPEVLLKALGEVINKAYAQYGYTAAGRYAQVVRSMAPTVATLTELGKELPAKRIAKLMLLGLGKTMTVGVVRYAILAIPTSIAEKVEVIRDSRRVRTEVQRDLSERPVIQTGRVKSCRASFILLTN